MGGALAAVLVGPWTGVLCLTVVLLVQGVLFADGGLTALGTNITLMGVVTVAVGWARHAARAARAAAAYGVASCPPRPPARCSPCPRPRWPSSRCSRSAAPSSSPLGTLAASMLGWHVLIGIGEAVITGADRRAPSSPSVPTWCTPRAACARAAAAHPDGDGRGGAGARRPAARVRASAGSPGPRLATASLLAGVVSFYASANPDGLEFVAGEHGFLDSAKDSAVAGSPLADYGISGIADARLSGGLAGVIGVVVTVAIALAVFAVLSRRRAHRATRPARDSAADRAPERV